MNLLHELTQRLSTVYDRGEAIALARWVMEEGFHLSLTDLMMGKDNELSAEDHHLLQNIIERLLRKEPIQYIWGHTDFCGLSLHVEPGVLIPRPETQELARWILQDYPTTPSSKTRTALDIGTGSGCLALTMAKAGLRTWAWDISTDALRIASGNASQLGLEVTFQQKDILHIEPTELHFDVIVSNPPYICQHEAKDMDENVLLHEPHVALFVPDEDPLLFYRAIARFASTHLTKDGSLYFEINRAYGQETCHLLQEEGFSTIILRQDDYDNDRMIKACR